METARVCKGKCVQRGCLHGARLRRPQTAIARMESPLHPTGAEGLDSSVSNQIITTHSEIFLRIVAMTMTSVTAHAGGHVDQHATKVFCAACRRHAQKRLFMALKTGSFAVGGQPYITSQFKNTDGYFLTARTAAV